MISYLLVAASTLLTAVYYRGSQKNPVAGYSQPVGPRFSGLLCIALLFCMLLLPDGRDKVPPRTFHASTLKPVLAVLAVIGLYFMAFEEVGYTLDTTLFLLVTMIWCHQKSCQAALAALLFHWRAGYVFKYALSVPLPAGRLFSLEAEMEKLPANLSWLRRRLLAR